MLACVVNLSEGRRAELVAAVAAAGGRAVLDVHTDPHHHRSVLTLAGPDVEEAAFAVASAAVALLDLRGHAGAHPRLGVVDVVPFAPLPAGTLAGALAARGRFADRAGTELALPCFLYGPERGLPEVRREAFSALAPATGPPRPHPTAGAACVGARPVLVAYNLWLAPGATLDLGRRVARAIRGDAIRALAFDLGGRVQVSCNLVAPDRAGPAEAFDAVARRAPVARAELVGLVPAAVLEAVPTGRWAELDVGPSRTIEARLEQAGLDGGRP